MYELLCAYAEKFGQDFPISAVMKTSNENGVIQLVQKCINTDTPFLVAGKAVTKKKTTKTEK
ncbi:MAG: hypothetical protein PUB49_05070 [Selenomonadaceae bacterium]|nr:hypothetical protein [Selenomonadaceae bacterium]